MDNHRIVYCKDADVPPDALRVTYTVAIEIEGASVLPVSRR